MNIHHVLLFCFLSAASCGFVHARLSIFTGAEGREGTIRCPISSSGSWKFFCKEECAEDGILVKTKSDTANNGRYSIEYKSGSSGKMFLSVTIRNLTQSDSGRYKFGMGTSSGPYSTCEFEARVSDELMDKNAGFIWTNTEGENFTYPCIYDVDRSRFFFCKDDCQKEEDVLIETDQKTAQSGRYGIEYKDGSAYGLSVTITHMKTTDTGRYKCGYGRTSSPDSSKTFSVIVIEDPSTQTLRPFPTLAPSSSTPTATPPSLIGTTSGSSPPSPVSTEITEQPTAAVVTTSKPTQTLQHFSASAASSLISSTAPSVFSDTTDQLTVLRYVPHPDYLLPLVGCVSLVVVLLSVLLLCYTWKTVKKSRSIELSTIHENQSLAQKCEESL